MASDEALAAYLNDHLAGAAAGIELAEKLRDNNQGTELGKDMVALHHDITQDRDALEELMGHLDLERHPVKEAAASDPRLAAADYDRLIERARGQRRTLEPHRLAAAVASFSA